SITPKRTARSLGASVRELPDRVRSAHHEDHDQNGSANGEDPEQQHREHERAVAGAEVDRALLHLSAKCTDEREQVPHSGEYCGTPYPIGANRPPLCPLATDAQEVHMFGTRIANRTARGMAVGALILSLGATTFGG